MQIKSLVFKLFDLLRFSPIFQTHQLIGCPDSKSNQLGPSQLTLLNLLSCGIVLYSPDMAAALEITDLPQPKMIDLILGDGARYCEQATNCRRGIGFPIAFILFSAFLNCLAVSFIFSVFCAYLKMKGKAGSLHATTDFTSCFYQGVCFFCSISASLKTGCFPVEPQLVQRRVCSNLNRLHLTSLLNKVSSKVSQTCTCLSRMLRPETLTHPSETCQLTAFPDLFSCRLTDNLALEWPTTGKSRR